MSVNKCQWQIAATLSLLTPVLLILPVNAQESPIKGNIIEEVVVTATYRETSAMDTPLSISAADADMIEQLGATDLGGLFRSLPGLNVVGGDTGSNRIVVRGISSQTGTQPFQQTSSTVAVYIDDTPMTSANGPARQLGGTLFDIERVEVLKGPQGTLFGEGSQGGTIRYIYNQPNAEALESKLKAGYNWQDESDDPGFRIDGMLNIPLGDDFAVRLTAFTEEKAGWIDKVNLSPIEQDINTLQSTGGRLAAKWWATDRLTIRGSVFHVDTETTGAPIAQTAFQETANVRIPGLQPQSQDEFTLFNVRFDYSLEWADFTSTTSYFERETYSLSETPASVAGFYDLFIGFNVNLNAFLTGGDPLIPCNPGTQTPTFSDYSVCPFGDTKSLIAFNQDSTSNSDRFVQEFRLVSNGEGPWLWTAGMFYKTSDDFRGDFQPFLMGPGREAIGPIYAPLFSDPGNSHTDKLDEISVFGEATYLLGDEWEFTAGARVSKLEQEFESTTTRTDDTPVSPKLNIAWHPTENQLYYFSYSTGFRPGNVNNGMEFNARQFTAGGLPQEAIDQALSLLTYEGDEVSSYELGSKLTLADGRVQLTAAAYFLDWKDTILLFTDATIPSANNTYNFNGGAAHSQGLELDFSWMPLDRLAVRLAGDINEAEVDEDVSATVPKGNSLIYSPEWSLSASIDYTVNLTGSYEGRFRLDHQRVDSQFATADNNITVDAYDLTNLRFTLTDNRDSRWSAALFVNNLTGEEVVLNTFELLGTLANVYAQPQVVGIEFNWQAR
jgi:outer membrane receptor protein involved in Fe transport